MEGGGIYHASTNNNFLLDFIFELSLCDVGQFFWLLDIRVGWLYY